MGEKRGLLGLFKLDGLFDHLTGYIDAKIELYKVEIREKASGILSGVIVGVLLFCLGWFFIMFISIAAGFYLGSVLGSTSLGFLIISGFYLLLFLLLFFLRDRVGIRELFEKKLANVIKPKDRI